MPSPQVQPEPLILSPQQQSKHKVSGDYTPKLERRAAMESLKKFKLPMSPYLTSFASKYKIQHSEMSTSEATSSFSFKEFESLSGQKRKVYWLKAQLQIEGRMDNSVDEARQHIKSIQNSLRIEKMASPLDKRILNCFSPRVQPPATQVVAKKDLESI